MGGFFGVASRKDCVLDLFYGVDYHSHLGTRRGGMAVYGKDGFDRAIHNIENSYFRTKFEKDLDEFEGNVGIGVIVPVNVFQCQADSVFFQQGHHLFDEAQVAVPRD